MYLVINKKEIKMKIWVDDLRNPDDFIGDPVYQKDLVWAKNYSSAIDMIERNKNTVSCIHLDNDLGKASEKEGRHVFNEIEGMLYHGQLPALQKIVVHSDNSSAVDGIMSAKDLFREKYQISLTRVCYTVRKEQVQEDKQTLSEREDDVYGSPFSNKNKKYKR